MLQVAESTPAASESRKVKRIDAKLKKLMAEWKEVGPIYEKWEAGRHRFKDNDELQKFKRRYQECKKSLATTKQQLEEARRCRRPEGEESDDDVDDGFSAVKGAPKSAVKKAPRLVPKPKQN